MFNLLYNIIIYIQIFFLLNITECSYLKQNNRVTELYMFDQKCIIKDNDYNTICKCENGCKCGSNEYFIDKYNTCPKDNDNCS